MIHLAVALIVVAYAAADFGSDLWMNGSRDNRNWGAVDSVNLGLTWLWFYHHRDKA